MEMHYKNKLDKDADEYVDTGIGLAIAKMIVEHQNDKIWVESEPGRRSYILFHT